MEKIECIDPLILTDIKDDYLLKKLAMDLANSFFNELDIYLKITDDFGVVEYATERAFLSMTLNGYCRLYSNQGDRLSKDSSFTIIQEYIIRLLSGNVGRPDCFLILQKEKEKHGFWIESKFDGFKRYPLNDDHWKKNQWKIWNAEILTQVKNYYFSELALSNNEILKNYKDLFLITLTFKLIKEVPFEHFEKANSLLNNKSEESNDFQNWFYSVAFLKDTVYNENEKSDGIEVFGTFNHVASNGENILDKT